MNLDRNVSGRLARIGILAVYGEAPALLSKLTVSPAPAAAGARIYQGELARRAVIVAEIGQGKVYAASAAQHLIDRYGVELLLCCGSAGALAPTLKPGDVLLAEQIVPHDLGWHAGDGFRYLGWYNSAQPDGRHYHHHLNPNSTLLDAAKQAAESVVWEPPSPAIVAGCLASGDQVIAQPAKKRWLHQSFGALAVEMESAAVAQVAQANGLPWLAVRAISDTADGSIDIDVGRLITYAHEPEEAGLGWQRRLRQAAHFARHPRQLRLLHKLRQGIRQAADHAARVTLAIAAQI